MRYPHPHFVLTSGKNNKSLKLLDLSNNQINLCGGSEEELAAFQRNTTLEYLILSNNRLVIDSDSFALFRVFMWHLPEVCQISSFLTLQQSLRHLNLSFVGLETQQTAILCDATLEKKNLRHLDISDNMIGRESGDAISTFLRRNTHLRFTPLLPS